jgi:hypothetical protein
MLVGEREGMKRNWRLRHRKRKSINEISREIDPGGSVLGRFAGFCKHDNEESSYVIWGLLSTSWMTTVRTYMWRTLRAHISDLEGLFYPPSPQSVRTALGISPLSPGWYIETVPWRNSKHWYLSASVIQRKAMTWLKLRLAWPFHDYYYCWNHQIELRTSITAKPQWRNMTTYRNFRITNKGQRDREAGLSVCLISRKWL